MKRNTQRQILKTAIDLFMEHGYDSVTINQICEACNITKGTFYYHYDSKESLLLNYYSVQETDPMELIRRIEQMTSFRDRCWEVYKIYLEMLCMLNKDLLKNLLIVNLNHNNMMITAEAKSADCQLKNISRLIMEYTQKAREAGEISSPEPAEALSFCFVSSFIGLALQWCSYEIEKPLMDSTKRLFDMIYR